MGELTPYAVTLEEPYKLVITIEAKKVGMWMNMTLDFGQTEPFKLVDVKVRPTTAPGPAGGAT